MIEIHIIKSGDSKSLQDFCIKREYLSPMGIPFVSGSILYWLSPHNNNYDSIIFTNDNKVVGYMATSRKITADGSLTIAVAINATDDISSRVIGNAFVIYSKLNARHISKIIASKKNTNLILVFGANYWIDYKSDNLTFIHR
jgi:hypothetical protein